MAVNKRSSPGKASGAYTHNALRPLKLVPAESNTRKFGTGGLDRPPKLHGYNVRSQIAERPASAKTGGPNLQKLMAQVQRDVTLLAEEIRRSTRSEMSRTADETDTSGQAIGATPECEQATVTEEMSSAIEEIYRQGAEITAALDKSREI